MHLIEGLTELESSAILSDIVLMRVGIRVKTEHMYPLTAELLESVEYFENLISENQELRQNHSFLVMVEWRRRIRNDKADASAGQLADVLKKANIDPHIVCLVC